jgi:Predicted membrane protein (DUF2306)
MQPARPVDSTVRPVDLTAEYFPTPIDPVDRNGSIAWFVGAIALFTAVASLGRTFVGHRTSGPAVLAAHSHPWMLGLHLVVGPIVLVTGAIQLLPGWFERHPEVHRAVGRLYVASALIVALTGIWVGRGSPDPIARAGFLIMSVLLIVCVLAALGLALEGAVGSSQLAHEDWAIRSYVLVYAPVTFPVLTAALRGFAHLPPDVVYRWAAWGCWALPLSVVESFRRVRRR